MTVEYSMDELLPHRQPMQLVHGLHLEGEQIIATFRVDKDCVFADDSGVPSWVGIEIMAQAVAARNSYLDKLAGITDVKEGMLLAIKRYQSQTEYFALGEVLQISMEVITEDGPMRMYTCHIQGQQAKASGTISVMQQQ